MSPFCQEELRLRRFWLQSIGLVKVHSNNKPEVFTGMAKVKEILKVHFPPPKMALHLYNRNF